MTSTGITRDMVLTAAAGLRAPEPSSAKEAATDAILRDIVRRAAGVESTSTELVDYTAYPTQPELAIDGVLVDASVHRVDDGTSRSCTVVVLAATDPAVPLGGTATISTTARPDGRTDASTTLSSSPLSGDTFVSAPLDTSDSGALLVAVTGGAPAPAVTTPATSAPRSAAEKAAARTAYDQALASARKKYLKAKKKAKGSKKKKAAATKAYAKRKASAKARYRSAVADVPVPATTSVPSGPVVLTISTDAGWALAG